MDDVDWKDDAAVVAMMVTFLRKNKSQLGTGEMVYMTGMAHGRESSDITKLFNEAEKQIKEQGG